MKKIVLLVMLFLFLVVVKANTEEIASMEFKGETVSISGIDGVNIKADVYETQDIKAPVILLFHQAGFSRGEYRETAPLLNNLGFNCIAIDQRSGKGVNGIANETFLEATKKGLGTKYPDAFIDLKSGLKFAMRKYPANKIIVLGSSYSASLVFILAQKYFDTISAVIAFSPGEYFKFKGRAIKEYAKKVKCAVFITSAKNEHDYWEEIYESIPGSKKSFFLPESNGVHGSKALWKVNPNHQEYWKALKRFLSLLKK